MQKKVLGNIKPITVRPGSIIKPADLDQEKTKLSSQLETKISNKDLVSFLMYPKVFLDFFEFRNKYSDPSILPTPLYFYGPKLDQEYHFEIEKGKSLIVRYLAKGKTNKDGKCPIFFELNGQPRTIEIEDNNEKFLEYFDKYSDYLTKISFNSFTKSVLDHKF